MAASGLLVVAVSPAGAQEPTAPPGGREVAPTVVPGAASAGTAPLNAGVLGTAAAGTAAAAPTSVAPADSGAEQSTETRSADAESERRVRRIVLTLLAIAAVMAAATVAFWLATRPVSPELDRLARMGSRGFRRARPHERTEMLGASPLTRLEGLGRGSVNGEPVAGAAAVVAGSPVVSDERAADAALGQPVASELDAAAAEPDGGAAEPDGAAAEPDAPVDEPVAAPEPDAALAESDFAVDEADPSVVEPDPAVALERPVILAPEESLDEEPETDDSPESASSDGSAGPDREPSAGPVTN
jgi:hypothetical protein